MYEGLYVHVEAITRRTVRRLRGLFALLQQQRHQRKQRMSVNGNNGNDNNALDGSLDELLESTSHRGLVDPFVHNTV